VAEESNENNKEENWDPLDKVQPTLFIAVGGTGAEVLWRIRRRILNTLWNTHGDQPVQLNSLTEFPFAQFLQIDLDHNTVTETGKATRTDLLSSKIRFKEEEKVVKKLDLSKYTSTDNDLKKYSLIAEWFPLTRSKINELNINVKDGAGQIRAISRLYFFDQYASIRSKIAEKMDYLLSNVTSTDAARRLGFETLSKSLKVVVVASTAGGTGSGGFLDLGYLIGMLGQKTTAENITTNLVLVLPTGYSGIRTLANTYGALMELETCMREGLGYIKRWNESEIIRNMPDKPYDDVYLEDTANLAGAQTGEITDVYNMLADALFEDFSIAGFANRKRSIAANQKQQKSRPYNPETVKEISGDMELSFSRGYSSFGQATIDTHLEQKKNDVLYRHVNSMLKAFFGVSAEDNKSNHPTEGERDELLDKYMYLGVSNETLDYDFVAPTERYRKGIERTTYPLVRELLRINGVVRLDAIEQQITETFDAIRDGGNYKEWPSKIAQAIDQINHDTFKAVESGSGLHVDAVEKRRAELLNELLDAAREEGLIKALWARVDNKERGGLDYTIELIQRIKDRLENANTGLIKALEENARWFADLSGHLSNQESAVLQEHLRQAIGKFIGAQAQSEAKLKQIAQAVRLYVRYHLYATACSEAAKLLRELSDKLGKQRGTDAVGNPLWTGFMGELEAGRSTVRSLIQDAEERVARTQEAIKQGHAMYFVLPTPKSALDRIKQPSPEQARTWAEEAFQDFGGTQQLFALLQSDGGRSELLSKLYGRARQELIGNQSGQDETNPLFEALKDESINRAQLFSDFLQRAMPWVAAKLDGFLNKLEPEDQYQCVIGVKGVEAFRKDNEPVLLSQLPASTLMTQKKIKFVEIDTPGKLVCYVELSGLPLPSLRALDDWYGAYREENSKIPVNTHKHASTFVHPRELMLDELAERAADFKLFVEAVASGVLMRTNKEGEEDIYKLSNKGAVRRVGSEKDLRMEGFGLSYRPTIQQQVALELEKIQTVEQLALWVALLTYYQFNVYPLKLIVVDKKDVEKKSLPTLVCERLVAEWRQRLESKLEGDAAQTDRLLRTIDDSLLATWTEEIPGSVDDVYAYELNKDELKPKRALKKEVLTAGWTLQPQAAGAMAAVGGVPPAVPPVIPTAVASSGTPPPIPSTETYHIAVNGQQEGPYTLTVLQQKAANGQLTRETLVWRSGMANWIPAGQLSELHGFFMPSVPQGD